QRVAVGGEQHVLDLLAQQAQIGRLDLLEVLELRPLAPEQPGQLGDLDRGSARHPSTLRTGARSRRGTWLSARSPAASSSAACRRLASRTAPARVSSCVPLKRAMPAGALAPSSASSVRSPSSAICSSS